MTDADDAASRAELERYLARERTRLVGLARRILRDEHEAEDVVQETIAAVLRRLGAERPRDLAAYVFKAVERNALKVIARRRTGAPLDAQAASTDQPDDEGVEFDPVALEQALMQLPATQQVVIRMKYYMGYTFRQIGEVLAISMNTAASRCRYALAALRKQIGARIEERGRSEKE
jgi:RNA polymerase sigma-70 factor (ECF subfamily)